MVALISAKQTYAVTAILDDEANMSNPYAARRTGSSVEDRDCSDPGMIKGTTPVEIVLRPCRPHRANPGLLQHP